MKYKEIFFAAFLFLSLAGYSQLRSHAFTRQDTLRGSITPEREWWDLTFYHLDINTNPADSSLSGQVLVRYTVLEENNIMQIDLQPPLLISSVKQDGQKLKYKNDGNVWFVELLKKQQAGNSEEIIISYGGRPKVSRRPPWDHGITWQYDKNGNPFYASTCQGGGASVWWPCKDHMYDEPDSMKISVSTPCTLMNV